jgi:uncharacterized protein YjbI with pentapeptide repeats
MSSTATLRVAPPAQVLEHLSIGEPIQDTRVTGLLDLDPLVVSRWLCGEDLRGVYQPIILRNCVLDGLDLEGRTFYEMVELVGCHIAVAHFKHAYFYSSLLVEDCVFEGDFEGRGIQSDGRVVVHNTIFNGWADFSAISLRGRADLVDVSFPGGTNLLRRLTNGARDLLGRQANFSGCRFRAVDVPAGLDAARWGITPLIECDLGGAERQWREFVGREEGDPVRIVGSF